MAKTESALIKGLIGFLVPRPYLRLAALLVVIILTLFSFVVVADSGLCDPVPCPRFYFWRLSLQMTPVIFLGLIGLIYLPACVASYVYGKIYKKSSNKEKTARKVA